MTGTTMAESDTNTTPERATWLASLDPATRELLDADAEVFLHQTVSTPCLDVLDRASGSTIIDIEGREFLDLHGNSVHQVGYGHPKVVAAIKAELDRLPFSPRRYTNRTAIALAQRLVALAPGDLGKALFSPGGASANGIALKLARYATGRHKTISLWDSFHGANLDTISAGGEHAFRHGVGPLLPGGEHVPPMHLAERFFGDDGRAHERLADYIDYMLEVQGDVSAVIAEPIRWTTAQAPPADFWPRVRASCDRHGALLIFDEIPSGLGRTGTMFACQQFDVVPDILVLGKGLGGGIMPMAATIVRRDLDIAPDAALGHYTHEKSSLGCAAALATLDVIESEGLVQRARVLGESGLVRLRETAAATPLLAQVRGCGLHWGLDVAPTATHSAGEVATQIMYACLERGLSFKVGGGDVVVLCPPMTIAESDLSRAFDILEAGLAAVEGRMQGTG